MSLRPLILLAALALAGCTGNSLGLSGAGSMLVEVAVYKGPLSTNLPVQIGELRAVVGETGRTLALWLLTSGAPIGCAQPDCPELKNCASRDCLALREGQQLAGEILVEICELKEYVDSVEKFTTSSQCTDVKTIVVNFRNPHYLADFKSKMDIAELKKHEPEIARRLSQLAGDMKSKGFRVADHLISYVPRNRLTRSWLTNLNLIMSEYSNQIQARVSVLDKQFAVENVNDYSDQRKRLPVGDYLRDASPTDFIHLFEWFNAGDAEPDTPGQLTVEERVRMAERLFADYYWEKINEVYASGQGDVSMAFIKNDIGNWDLKSFSNDPEMLVGAYRSAADAVIASVADVASGGTTKELKAGQGLLDLGNRLATGESRAAPNLGVLNASALHGRTLSKLATRRAAYAEQEKPLIEAKQKADKDVDTATNTATSAAGKITTKQQALTAAEGCQPPTAPAAQPATPTESPAAPAAPPGCQSVEAARNELAGAQLAKTAADADLDSKKLAAEKAAADLTAVRKAAQKDIRDILDDHLALIAMLQEAVAGPAQPQAPTTIATPDIAGLPKIPTMGQVKP